MREPSPAPSPISQRQAYVPLVFLALLLAIIATAIAMNRSTDNAPAAESGGAEVALSTPAERLAALPDAKPGNYDRELPRFDPRTAPVKPGAKTFELVATERKFKVGTKVYEMWTFNDSVPGPTLRAVQGDRITIRITNHGSSTFVHSVDYHASRLSLGGGHVQVPPGETGQFSFVAEYPGVFMYHCGTPPILHHIGLGMYGMLIVQPKRGFGRPMPEYAFVQSELYGSTRDLDRSLPTQMAFNGIPGQYMEQPIKLPADSDVRMFVLNAGPSEVSSFHVVGTIFDRVLEDGNPANATRGRQALALPASGSGVFEMRLVGEGRFPFVTHQFDHGAMGAGGMIETGDGDPVGDGSGDHGGH